MALLIFAVIEMGSLFHDQSSVANAAREAARGIAAGDSVDTATSRAKTNTAGLVSSNLSFAYAYSTDNGATFTNTITNDTSVTPTSNTAPSGSLVKVTASYQHNYITGIFSSRSVTINSVVMLRREQ